VHCGQLTAQSFLILNLRPVAVRSRQQSLPMKRLMVW
jgi:hypothetical protein